MSFIVVKLLTCTFSTLLETFNGKFLQNDLPSIGQSLHNRLLSLILMGIRSRLLYKKLYGPFFTRKFAFSYTHTLKLNKRFCKTDKFVSFRI